MTLYLSRARFRADASARALAPLLMPENDNDRALASHRLAWSLMPADACARRDFLWREEAPGRLMLLSARPPESNDLFEVEYKEFAPALVPGEKLRFVLRANATIAQRKGDTRGKRQDVVMHALHAISAEPRAGERAAARPELVRREGAAWLARVAARSGFNFESDVLNIDGYRVLQVPRPGGRPIRFATLDYAGAVTITDPTIFLATLAAGFGRARAFGCGLMLIRRSH